jgi:hypothetical protein
MHHGIAFDTNGVLADGQHRLAAMVRTMWLYENRPDLGWSGGKSAVTNHQIV